MTIYSISSLIASLLCLVVGIVSLYTRKSKSHFALATITFAISIWTLFPFLTTIIVDPHLRLVITRFLYIPAAIVPASFLYLTLAVLDSPQSPSEKIIFFLSRFLTIVFILLAF